MKSILFLLLAFSLFSCSDEKKIIYSNKKNIKVFVNGQSIDWRISPENNPDILSIYCIKAVNKVKFQTDIDSVTFSVRNKDTISFRIILNSRDTAETAIAGIKDLPDRITGNEKVYWLSQLWSETKYNFVNIDRITFDLDSLYKSYIPAVLSTRNDFEYFKVLQKFIASLHDGHSEVSWSTFPYTDYIPVLLKDFNKRVYVVSVRKMPGLDSAWLGAELIEVDNIPTAEYLGKNIFPYVSASTEQSLWMQGVTRLQNDFKNSPFKGTIRKSDGTTEKIELARNGESTRTQGDEYWGPASNYPSGIVNLKWLENDVALISFNRFSPEDRAIMEFGKIAKDLQKAKGLIIDLRRNGGGSTVVANYLQQFFTREANFLNYAWETRISDGVRKANGNWLDEYKSYFLNKAYRFEKPAVITVPDTIKRIECKTVILIGRYTFSAAEDFLVNIYETPDRPMLIGEETGGSTGSPLVIMGFPEGAHARICTRRICYPVSGRRFVNRGVRPDIEVSQTIGDYLDSKDTVLERAILELNK